mmetsp:Transcript_25032/g.45539  ORF Transcript_25032/g.45539 Transcript_25032/m.45539 type:complete len:322 (-) Transcript_25032:96-1061(-)
MLVRSMALTAETFDDLLDKIEDCFRMLDGSVIQLPQVELDLLRHLESASFFMTEIERAPDMRGELENIFGSDRVRICRIRAVLDGVNLSDTNAGDERSSLCSNACDSLEKVLSEQSLSITDVQEEEQRLDSEQIEEDVEVVADSNATAGAEPCENPSNDSMMNVAGAAPSPKKLQLHSSHLPAGSSKMPNHFAAAPLKRGLPSGFPTLLNQPRGPAHSRKLVVIQGTQNKQFSVSTAIATGSTKRNPSSRNPMHTNTHTQFHAKHFGSAGHVGAASANLLSGRCNQHTMKVNQYASQWSTELWAKALGLQDMKPCQGLQRH